MKQLNRIHPIFSLAPFIVLALLTLASECNDPCAEGLIDFQRISTTDNGLMITDRKGDSHTLIAPASGEFLMRLEGIGIVVVRPSAKNCYTIEGNQNVLFQMPITEFSATQESPGLVKFFQNGQQVAEINMLVCSPSLLKIGLPRDPGNRDFIHLVISQTCEESGVQRF